MKKIILLLFLAIFAYFFLPKNDKSLDSNPEQDAQTDVKVQDIEFAEMTIPYLRARKYESTLYPLKPFRTATNYSSFITSYNSDSLRINGLITIPKGKKPDTGWPAIVFVHGYIDPTKYRTTEKYDDYVNYLASRGYVVFKIDLRGHGDSEGEPGGSYYSSDYVIDTLNSIDALRSSDFVDPESIGLWGHSMAGNVTLRSFVVAQDIKALVVWAGAGYSYDDLLKYGLNDGSYRPPSTDAPRQIRRALLRATHGEFNKDSDFWSKVTPINYLSGLKGAIQVHHALNDNVVNIGYARDFMKILDDAEVSHTLYEYQSGGHNISGAAFTDAMSRTVDFYNAQFSIQ